VLVSAPKRFAPSRTQPATPLARSLAGRLTRRGVRVNAQVPLGEILVLEDGEMISGTFDLAIDGAPSGKMHITMFFKNMPKYQPVIRNNAGGHFNHTFFWETLNPNKSLLLGGLDAGIKKKWLTLDAFKAEFNKAALGVFGSGWVWLCVNKSSKELFITTTPNQDNTLMVMPGNKEGVPLIALDVWEHAYYLKHQNNRKDYIEAFWNLVDWNKAELRFQEINVTKK
jgi:Fe-Mn family superoxide dismutase